MTYTAHFDGFDLLAIASCHERLDTLAEELSGAFDLDRADALTLGRFAMVAGQPVKAQGVLKVMRHGLRARLVYQIDHPF